MSSWFPSPFGRSSSSSRPSPSTASSSMSSSMSTHHSASGRPQPQSSGPASPAEAAGVITCLKKKSTDELKKLLTDKSAYEVFFNSLEQVKVQKNLHRELREETRQLARGNLEKEPCISELRNQCTVIRTSELAAAQEKLTELEKQKDEILKFNNPSALLNSLQDAMNEAEEESEALDKKLLEKEIDMATFIQKYKKSRNVFHRRALLHLAAKTCIA